MGTFLFRDSCYPSLIVNLNLVDRMKGTYVLELRPPSPIFHYGGFVPSTTSHAYGTSEMPCIVWYLHHILGNLSKEKV